MILNLSIFFTNLFIFTVFIAHGNVFFILKFITFALFILFNVKNLSFARSELFPFIIFLVCYLVSIIIMLVSGIKYDLFYLEYHTVSVFLLGAILFTNSNYIDLWKPLESVAMLIGLSTLIIYTIVLIIPIPESIMFLFSQPFFQDNFMVSTAKQTLFWVIPSVFHKSSPILIIVFGYNLYLFFGKKGSKQFFKMVYYFLVLVATGTRANMLAVLLVFFIMILYYLFYIKKYIRLSSLLFLIGIYCFSILIFLLISVKNSSSLVKDNHTLSYFNLFANDIKYFLFGQGIGSLFYTTGFHRYTTTTEVSYLELIRILGIFSAIIVLCIYTYPLIKLFVKKTFFSFSIAISYLAYLFIAGTNPLLIGPTGFMVLVLIFYFKNHEKVYIIHSLELMAYQNRVLK